MSRFRWFGHVERKDDNDWVKRCITWEVERIRQRLRPKKTWWDCVKNDMESLGLSQKDAQSMNKWRRRVKDQAANPGSPGRMAVKMECQCVRVCFVYQLYFMSLCMCIFLSVLTAIFPVNLGEPVLLKLTMMEVVVTAGVYKLCKALLKSSPPTSQHPTFYRLDALPVTQCQQCQSCVYVYAVNIYVFTMYL